MPETLFLHIESRGRTATRVLELPGDSLRIGRGAQCEVRLAEPSLAEVECLLRRRGEVWHIQPLGPPGKISIDGRPVAHLRALATGVPLRVGEHTLTLRPTRTVSPGFGSFAVPIPVGPSPAVLVAEQSVEIEPLDERGYPDPTRVATRPVAPVAPTPPLATPTPRADLRETWTKARHDERHWEARWRAAGQNLRARETPARPVEPPEEEPAPAIVPFPVRPVALMPLVEIEDAEPKHDRPATEAVGLDRVIAEDPPAPTSASAALEQATGTVEDGIPAPIAVPSEDAPHRDAGRVADYATAEVWAGPPASSEGVISAVTETPSLGESWSRTTGEHVATGRPERDGTDANAATTGSPEGPRRAPSASTGPLLSPAPPPRRPRSSRRPQSADRVRAPRPDPDPPLPEIDDLEWPSARVILAAHQAATRRGERPAEAPAKAKAVARQLPTEAVEPAHWSPPFWLGWTGSFAAVVVVGAVGLFLSWTWGADSREAGMLADRLLHADAKKLEPFADGEVNPDAAWWRTTGGHLALKAAALGITRGDAAREETVDFLLDSARKASPLEPSTRLARAQKQADGSDPASVVAALGLSRDTVSLALTGRRLARQGKTDAALAAYRSALELAVKADIGRGRAPVFLDASEAKRFALPYEEMIAGIVKDMAEQPDWTFARWSAALPEHGLVLLATYRVLREQLSPEADGALDRLVAAEAPPHAGAAVLHAAARAEGLAIKGRLEEAASLYQEAIEGMPDESIRRTFWLNLGEILARGGDRAKATDALMAARAGRGDDAIGARAGQAMTREGLGDRATSTATASPGAAALKLRGN